MISIKKVWNSPTIMTWMSYSSKVLALFGVLPLVLKCFTPEDIVLWYLFSTIISLQTIADLGFRQTFSRLISYTFMGAESIDNYIFESKSEVVQDTSPNFELLTKIVSIMKFIYVRLTIILLILMVGLGSWSLQKPISISHNVTEAWISWAVVVVVSCIGFYTKIYLNFLEGLFKIALVRRVETFTSIGSIISSIVVLLTYPTLLNLIIVNQLWVLIVAIRDWYLCNTVDGCLYKKVALYREFDSVFFRKIWQSAWRSGVSNFMSAGLTNLTGLVYAQFGTSEGIAAYLLAIRIINQVKDVSMAPFYSKIPLLAMLRVKNDIKTLLVISRKGMFLSHMVFVIGFILVGIFSDVALDLIHSESRFVEPKLWLLIGFAFFVHRFGAMHIQVYLSTNHIISHVADGISGVLYILSSVLLSNYIGVYSIPVGMLIGYLGFYSWYAAQKSYWSLNVDFFSFELKASFLPICIFILYTIFVFAKSTQWL